MKVCTVKNEYPTFTLWQRFLGDGPLASLAMWDNYASIIWSLPNSKFDNIMNLSDDEFLVELNNAFRSESRIPQNIVQKYLQAGERVEAPLVKEICNKRLSFPLVTASAHKYSDKGMALVGDAAHSIHPMAGQGLNLGLLDSNILANILCKSINEGAELGCASRLFEYEFHAKKNNYIMQSNMEALKLAYGFQAEPLAAVRNFGMDIINRTPLKKVFMHGASGKMFEETRRLYLAR